MHEVKAEKRTVLYLSGLLIITNKHIKTMNSPEWKIKLKISCVLSVILNSSQILLFATLNIVVVISWTHKAEYKRINIATRTDFLKTNLFVWSLYSIRLSLSTSVI